MTNIFNLYLVRHGESYNNSVPQSQRVCDPPLTELGQAQAIRLADRIHHEFDHSADRFESADRATDNPILSRIYTSAFLRTMQTIYPATQLTGAAPVIWTELFEVGGCFDGHLPGQTTGRPGMTHTEIAGQFSTYKIPSDIDDNGWYKSKPRETPELAETRTAKVVQQLFDRYHGDHVTVMCVIHGDLIRMLMRNLLPDQPDYGTDVTHNTSVTHLRFTADRTPQVVLFNDTSHLTREMLSV